MRRSWLVILVGVFMVTVGAGFAAPRMTESKPALPTDKNHVVELKAGRAEPSAIAVTKGDYVQFNTKDGKIHNIGQGRGNDQVHQEEHIVEHVHDYNGKVSGTFGSDEGYRVRFNQTGTFEFHDHLNPKISVVVIVYESKT